MMRIYPRLITPHIVVVEKGVFSKVTEDEDRYGSQMVQDELFIFDVFIVGY